NTLRSRSVLSSQSAGRSIAIDNLEHGSITTQPVRRRLHMRNPSAFARLVGVRVTSTATASVGSRVENSQRRDLTSRLKTLAQSRAATGKIVQHSGRLIAALVVTVGHRIGETTWM